MAVNEIVQGGTVLLPRNYLGLSTDTMPTTDINNHPLAPGSSFTATDNGKLYFYDGTAWWVSRQPTKEVVWQTALAITDTAAHFLPSIDISDASDFYIMGYSTLNQDSTISVSALDGYGDTGMEVTDNSPGQNALVKTTLTQSRVSIFKSPNLNFGLSLNGFLKCTVAPTSGTLAVYIVKRM